MVTQLVSSAPSSGKDCVPRTLWGIYRDRPATQVLNLGAAPNRACLGGRVPAR